MDFQGIKNRVEEERKRRQVEGVQRGDMSMLQGNAPKDSLLHELQISLRTGKPTQMVENMRQVDRMANTKGGASGKPPKIGGGLNDALSKHISVPPKQQQSQYPQQTQQPRQQIHEDDNSRDKQFDKQFEHRSNSNNNSLSQQLGEISGANNGQMNPQQKMMESYQKMSGTQQPMQQYTPNQQQQYNPTNINEQVNEAIGQVDFASLLQESLKNTIMEMYAVEKVQKSLLENKDIIKKIVRETLIELSQANKKKTTI